MDDILDDVVMVRGKDNVWQLARIAKESEDSDMVGVCTAQDMEFAWYHSAKVAELDRRLGTSYDTVAQRLEAEAARAQLTQAFEQGTLEITGHAAQTLSQAYTESPENNAGDPKCCLWSPAFIRSQAGIEIGRKALHGDQPCEVIAAKEKKCVQVHYPWTRTVEIVPRDELKPYSYVNSGACPYRPGPSNTPNHEMFSSARMARLDQILLKDVYRNRGLMNRLQQMSFEEDGPGVSFLIGVSPNTGVPYALMTHKEIATIWMEIRELYMELDSTRLKGNKFTGIKISLNSKDTTARSYRRDLGDAATISGGVHVGGDLDLTEQGGTPVDTWGKVVFFSRRNKHATTSYEGNRWSITFFSDYKSRNAQSFARVMMDSIAQGTLIDRPDFEDKGDVYRVQDEELEIKHTDKKYPPWIDQPKDPRGLPLPKQPADLGPDNKWKVEMPTDVELQETLQTIGVTNNDNLDDTQKWKIKELVCYCWSMFDDRLRPVDSPPVGFQFKDPMQQPIRLQPYRTNAPKLAILQETIKEWIQEGVIAPSDSPWGFPVVMVPKPHGKGWRVCVDLRRLNDVIKHDSYMSPRNDDALVWLASKKIRSTLDIKWGYHNLMLAKRCQEILTFVTAVGSYKYIRLPFGLATAGSLFQRYMNKCLDEWLWREAIAVVDDIAIGTETIESHLEVVIKILCHLTERGFSVKAEKMRLFVDEFIFLGHLSTPDGLRATDSLVEAVKRMPIPDPGSEDPRKQLRSFLGMASYQPSFKEN